MIHTRIFHSVSFRLTMLYAALFSASVLLLCALLYISVRHSLESQLRNRILSETEQLMGDYNDDGLEELRHDIRERTDSSRAHRLRYALEDAAGKTLFDAISHAPAEGWSTITTASGDTILRFTTPLKEGYRLHVGADLDALSTLARAMRTSVIAVLLFTLALSVIGGTIISRRFLARIDKLTRTTETIGRGSLSSRLPVSPLHDDFDQLAITINRMLERIETLIAEVKLVSTSIAHDMRTPLGRLRQKLESLQSATTNTSSAPLIEESITLLDETLETFASLLRLAEIEAGTIPAQHTDVDVTALYAMLSDTYSAIAEEQGQHITVTCPPHTRIHGDKALLTQLFANLIENAIRHAGHGARITLAAEQHEHATILSVSDTGRGIPEHATSAILKPFFRLDESRNTRGSGLGLSLVSAIATFHHATLTLTPNTPGLRITLRFNKA